MTLGPRSVRVRLTAWFVGALTAIVLIFAFSVYLWVRGSLTRHVERQLTTQFEAVGKALREHPEELRELEDHRAVDLFQVKEGNSTIYETAAWRRAGLSRATDQAPGDSGSKVRSEEDGYLY